MAYKITIILLSALVSGCSITNPKLYSGDLRPDSEQGVISSLGFYPEKSLAIQVLKIDGQPVNTSTAASFLALPKNYVITIKAKLDADIGTSSQGLTYSWKEAENDVELDVVAGHTYLPDATRVDGKIVLAFKDMGLNFPQKCLPLYIAVDPKQSKNCPKYAGHPAAK